MRTVHRCGVRTGYNSGHTSTWWVRFGAVTGALAIALQEIVEFSHQIPGNAILFVVLMVVAVHVPKPLEKRVNSSARREVVVCA